MIRPAIPEDTAAILALGVAAGLFLEEETAFLKTMLVDYFSDCLGEGHQWITDEQEGQLRGVIYYAPDVVGDRTWYVYMIAVQPECQGQGCGTALMQYVEHTLSTHGQRMVLVETSTLPRYERTRTFYEKCGYEREARIRDFYGVGDNKVIFRKVLAAD